MKQKLFTAVLALFLVSGMSMAQGKYSFGLVSSNLVNIGDDHKLSEIDQPFGYGFVLGAKLTKEATVAATFEYVTGDVENSLATQDDYRGHISIFVTPVNFGKFYPYFSGGAVISTTRTSLNNNTDDDTRLFARFGFGVDYKLISNFALNLDFGLYSNGMKFNGLSNSIGLRFIW